MIAITALMVLPSHAIEGVSDGFSVWTTNFDSYSAEEGYPIVEWVYDGANEYWDGAEQYLTVPYFQTETHDGNVYDMAFDMIEINGELSAIIAVSKGTGHFPSQGTEFQHRKLNANGEWEPVQEPIFKTPADVSPLGVDIYKVGDEIHIVWVEDNDAAGPKSMKCEIYDQVLTLSTDGTLTTTGEPTLIYTSTLNWSASYPSDGGVNGVAACDYDGDNDIDYVMIQMFYGDSPDKSGIHLIEQTSPGVWSDLQELIITVPGGGSEALTCADIDGDDDLDFLKTNEDGGAWSQIYWYEKSGDEVSLVGMLIDCNYEGSVYEIPVGHIFGVYAGEPTTSVSSLSSWPLY